jgi:hypothetical protein
VVEVLYFELGGLGSNPVDPCFFVCFFFLHTLSIVAGSATVCKVTGQHLASMSTPKSFGT